MSMPCQMDAKQSLGENKQHAYFAIKYDLIPLGKVSQGEAHETHLCVHCTTNNTFFILIQKTTGRDTLIWKVINADWLTSHRQNCILRLSKIDQCLSLSAKNKPRMENQDSTQLLLSKVKGHRCYCPSMPWQRGIIQTWINLLDALEIIHSDFVGRS